MNFRLSCFILLLLSVLVSCSNSDTSITGVWVDPEGNTLEFREDGSWYSKNPDWPYPQWGTWAITEEKTEKIPKGLLLMRYGNPPMPVKRQLYSFHFGKSKLKIQPYSTEGDKDVGAYRLKRQNSAESVSAESVSASSQD